MIQEIWGNGIDVIIKYKKEGFNNIWFAASKWLINNSNLNNAWLKKNGYRKLDLERCLNYGINKKARRRFKDCTRKT